MYNYSTSNPIKASNPLVVSFDITSGVNQYSLGINPNQGYKGSTHELKVYRNTLQTKDSGDYNYNSGYTTVFNHQNDYLGTKSLIQQDFILSNQEYNVKINDDELTFYLGDVLVDFKDLDLHYSCYTTSQALTDKKDQVYFMSEQYYYKSFMEVIPVVCHVNSEDEVITLGDQSGLSLLNLDYGIKLDTSKNKITTIASIKNDEIIQCDYLINKDYDKVRFVISDYGRIISHSIHLKDSNDLYSNNKIHVFDSKNINDNVYVKFSTNNKSGVTNITTNF